MLRVQGHRIKGDAFDLRHFADEHDRAVKRVCNRIDDFLESPNEENVHGIRIAIRKVRISTSLLPRKKRKSKNSRKYIRSAKTLFSLTSRLRDRDIIGAKLRAYPQDPATRGILRNLESERGRRLRTIEKCAMGLRDQKASRPAAGSMDEERIAAKFGRKKERLSASIRRLSEKVTREEGATTELHQMRKRLKQLRYLLELVPPDPDTERLLDQLHGWQDRLGEIHDHDIVLGVLREQQSSPRLRQIIDSESRKRKKGYRAFLESYRSPELQGSHVP